MSETTNQKLTGVAATLLITLYTRAIESQRPDALIKDERAEALVRQMDPESLRKTAALTEDTGRVAVILKGREFDRFTRFERVDNGWVEWYDLDLPDVIELRRKLVGGEGARHDSLACSVLDSAWPSEMGAHHQRPVLFLAEGVFEYFDEAQVKSLVLTMKEHFPDAELVFDAFSPFLRWAHNIKVTRTGIGAHLHQPLPQYHNRSTARFHPSFTLPLSIAPSNPAFARHTALILS